MKAIYRDLFHVDSQVIAYGAKIRHSQNQFLIQKWDLKINGYYLIVGRLVPDNNADIIIKGFLKSSSKRKLVVVGDVPYHDEYATTLKDLAEKDERLIFTGYVKDQDQLAELYHHCYCYFHGHEYGGTNPTMLKAMAYGCAILALDTRFNHEMLQSGRHGIYFEKEVLSVLKLINEVENRAEKVAKLKETARDGITSRYTWSVVTDQYLDLFLKAST